MTLGKWTACVAAWLGLMVWAAAASAQTNSSIAGTVKDPDGAVLPGVTVQVSSPALIERSRAVVTDGTGQYRVIELRPGTYAVSFTLPGFATVQRTGIELTTGFTATVNADMRVGEISETVTVSGTSPVVDTQNVITQRVVTRNVIDTLPTGKVFANLGALVPGMTTGGFTYAKQDVGGSSGYGNNTLAIHGGRAGDQLVALDGMPVSISYSSISFLLFPDSNVEEINLQTGSHQAEFEAGGVRVNFVPKSGSNTFSGWLAGAYTNEHLQTDNLTDQLRARGLNAADRVKYLSDFNPAVGGPIMKDKLWFYAGYRSWRTVRYTTKLYDTDPKDWVYTPDLTRGAIPYEQPTWSASGRVTWQASRVNKFSFNIHRDIRCECQQFVDDVGGTLEASVRADYQNWLTQGTWTAPVTNQLLFDAGVSRIYSNVPTGPLASAVGPPARELATSIEFRSRATATGGQNEGYRPVQSKNYAFRFAMSYVTGAHNFKTGIDINPAYTRMDRYLLGDYVAVLLNGVPNRVEYVALPNYTIGEIRRGGIYVQDQWTMRRLTLNGGLRYEQLRTFYPAMTFAPTNLLPQRSFPGADVVDWKDILPRMGAALDIFGTGRTVAKVSFNRYVITERVDLLREASPADAAGGRNNRSWVDTNRDFVPDGDALNPLENGELGPASNTRFGQPVLTLRQDPNWRTGWNVRPDNWEAKVALQHELLPRVAVIAEYIHRTYGKFSVIDNLPTTPADFDPYCVTAPRDSRLPGGGGQQICGLYDLNPSKLGLVDRVRTKASNFGDQYEYWHGVDLSIDARLPGGVLAQGGISTGKTVTDNCEVAAKLDNPSQYQCHQETPFRTQVKLLGSYMFPMQIQVAATYQVVPAFTPVFGRAASAIIPNAVIAPSLGRNLSAGATATAAVNVVEPGSLWGETVNQLDFRVSRTFNLGRGRLKGIVDLYNLTNANAVLNENPTYGTNGAAWLNPVSILQGRLVKFAAQLEF
jgi:hypothetical protein